MNSTSLTANQRTIEKTIPLREHQPSMHAQNAQRIWLVLQRDISCLFHYLSGAWPWTNRKERDIVSRLQSLLEAEQNEHSHLAAMLRKQRMVPPAASYPAEYSNYHYLALNFLLPQVLEEQKKLLANHQQEREQIVNDPAAESVLDAFL